jgi:pyruvate,water dikinase
MKKAAAIITNKGGRTSHAAIVALNWPPVVVAVMLLPLKNGSKLRFPAEGKMVTYMKELKWKVTEQDFSHLSMPETDPMFILADPDRAFELSNYPIRSWIDANEFAISNSIKIHPLAL